MVASRMCVAGLRWWLVFDDLAGAYSPDRRQLTSNPRSIRQSGHPVEESHGLNRRRTLLGPATVWADNVNPHPCGSRKMVERAAVDYGGTR
eukprot:g1907.t1